MNGNSAFVSGALALVLQVSRIAGIAPLRFLKQHDGWRISLSRCFSIYGCVLVSCFILATIATMVGELLVEPARAIRMRTATRRVVWLLDAGLVITLAFLGAITAPSSMKSMISCLNKLQKINNELNIIHWQRRTELKKTILFIFWSLITIVLTLTDYALLVMLIIQGYNDPILCIMYFFYYGCYWIMQLQIFQFMLITLHLRQSFKAVNDKLKKLTQALSDSTEILIKSSVNKGTLNKKRKKSLNTVIDSLAFVGRVNPVEDQYTLPAHNSVRCLALTYVSVCDVMRELDQRHGLVLLLLLSSFLLHMIVTPYYLINNIFTKSIEEITLNIVGQIMWCLFHGVNLLMVIEPCHLTTEELYVTQEQISHMMRYTSSFNEPLINELDLFFRHVLLNKVSFSPLKVTTLSRGLVATILGSITTYLVIIIEI